MRKALAVVLVVLACVALFGVGLAVVGTEEASIPDLGYGAAHGMYEVSMTPDPCNPSVDPTCN